LVRDISRKANYFRVTGTARPVTWEPFEEALAMDRAREAYEATRVAARDADEADRETVRGAFEILWDTAKAAKAMREADEADEHHEQD
jgi:hypothetical protein